MRTSAKVIARTRDHDDAGYHFAGMLIVSLLPALFWTLAIAGVGAAIGHVPSTTALVIFGTAVAAFCGAIFQGLAVQR